MRYLLDTNVILHLVRNSPVWQLIKAKFGLHEREQKIYISIVTYAEIKSIAKQLNWGEAKLKSLHQLLSTIPTLMLNKNLAEKYIEIDVYSQGKDKKHPLPDGVSARNMGKNDLWIAATTEHIKAELITTDKDFEHLNGVFFKVNMVEQ